MKQEARWIPVVHVPADWKGEGSCFFNGIDDYRLTIETDIETSMTTSPPLSSPPKGNSLDESCQRECFTSRGVGMGGISFL